MTKLTNADKNRYKEAQGNNETGESILLYIFYLFASTLLFIFSGFLWAMNYGLEVVIAFLLGLLFSYLLQMNILNPMYVMMKKAEDGELLCKKKN